MQTMLRRLLCLILTLVLALTLPGCGKDTPPTNTSTAAAAGTQNAESEVQPDPAVYNGLFEADRVHTVDVTISEADWDDLRKNPMNKTKYQVAVVIDGEQLDQVSFSTKGNTSLLAVAGDPESDRYSFKLNFGKFVEGQTYHGLNKLSLNNLYADATCLKDYLSYGLFRKAGVDAPLVSYVWLVINGKDHGLYIAIEDVSEAWLARTQAGQGVVYKPESQNLNPGDFPGPGEFPGGFPGEGGFPGGNMPAPPNGENGQPSAPPSGENGQPSASPSGENGQPSAPPSGENGQPSAPPSGENGQPSAPPSGENGQPSAPPSGENGQGFPGFPSGAPGEGGFPPAPGEGGFPFPGGNAQGADLRYIDDAPESYPDIFDNAETKMDNDAQSRVIAALKGLSEGRAADVLDTDEVIRYFAAHNFTLNYDSYTGFMLHNYFLYENNGKLAMLPWDYNLAYGAFAAIGPDGAADATALINTGIDTPLLGSAEESRPMWAWIAADETWLERYHAVFDELLTSYFESGSFETELARLHTLLRPYVEKDPTAFYTAAEFDEAVDTLRQVCLLRAESIRAQLNGKLATKTEAQEASARIDASDVTISTMGTHMGGGPGDFNMPAPPTLP